MVSNGCPVNALTNDTTGTKTKFSALHLALNNNDLKVTDTLLSNGAEIEIKDVQGKTPLHHACEKGYMDMVHLLTNRGASMEARTLKDERTPVQLACLKGHLDITIYLITCGANVTAKDGTNQTLLHMASSKGLHDIVQMCITQVQKSRLNTLEDNEGDSKLLTQDYLYVIF